MRRRIGIAAVLVAVLAVAASAAAATALVPVLVKGKPNPVWETTPAASGSFLAWSQNSAAHPNVFNEYAQGIAGGPIVRVNTLNSTADGGGIDGNRLVYQQIIKGQSDIRYFNLALHTHSNPPPGVNSTQYERLPTISGNWLLFGRQGGGTNRVLLFNLTTRSFRVLMSVKSTASYVEPGQVNGNWATFMSCSRSVPVCYVYRYDIAANQVTRIPRSGGKIDTAPAIASDGTLYFDRSNAQCGSSATVEELPVGGTVATVHSFNPGNDVETMRVINDGTNNLLYYAQLSCKPSGIITGTNIYKSIVD